jgi:hypothetical protein
MEKVEHKFSLYFDTDETTNHTMGASELGAALIGIDKTIEEANKLINGDDSFVQINVSAPEPGSIGVPIAVTALAGGIDIVSLLGFSGATGLVGGTVIEVISFLKSRKIESVVRNDNGKSTITVKSGKVEESYEVDTNIEKVVTNNAPVQSLTNPKILIKDFEGKKVLTEISTEEISSFKKLPRTTLIDRDDDTKKVHVRFIKIDFEKESGWVVDYLGDRLTVKIKDNTFMNKNKNNEQGFKSGDLFEVELNTIITIHPDKPQSIRYLITKVYGKLG